MDSASAVLVSLVDLELRLVTKYPFVARLDPNAPPYEIGLLKDITLPMVVNPDMNRVVPAHIHLATYKSREERQWRGAATAHDQPYTGHPVEAKEKLIRANWTRDGRGGNPNLSLVPRDSINGPNGRYRRCS